MKYLLANLGVNLVALACLIIAGILAFKGRDGWGWFLFVGLVCASSIEFFPKREKSKSVSDSEVAAEEGRETK